MSGMCPQGLVQCSLREPKQMPLCIAAGSVFYRTAYPLSGGFCRWS